MENYALCRICISESAVMMSIFGEDALWRKIAAFANVQIEEDDILPQQICMNCAKDAINACDFKQKCEDADRYFRRQVLKREQLFDVIEVSSDDDECIRLPNKYEPIDDKKNFLLITAVTSLQPVTKIKSSIYSPLPLVADAPITDPTPPVTPLKSSPPDEIPRNDSAEEQAAEQTPVEDRSIGHQCVVCFEYFAMKTILKHHIKTKHPETVPRFECFDCKRVYISKRFLDKHVRMGSCKKDTAVLAVKEPISVVSRCPKCSMEFATGHHLGWHKRSGSCPMMRSVSSAISVRPLSSLISQDLKTKSGNGPFMENNADSPGANTEQLHLDENQLSLAKSLVLQNATVQQIAAQLKTTEAYAIRLQTSISGLYNHEPKALLPDGCKNGDDQGGEQRNADMDQTQCASGSQNTSNNFTLPELFKGRPVEIFHNEFHAKNETAKPYRKPRKPPVFMNEEKYEKAKIIVANNGSTLDVANQLNISQMSAWKLRQCILKGVPLQFRRPPSPKTVKPSSERNSRNVQPRLKGADRIERDREVTNEILSILKEDNALQYWKISERLAEKGFHLTPPMICTKLKGMGIHRRWRQSTGNNSSCDEAAPVDTAETSKNDVSVDESVLDKKVTV